MVSYILTTETYMKKLFLVLSIAVIFCLISCTDDDIIIDNSINRDKIFIATNGDQPQLKVLKLKDGTYDYNDLFLEKTGEALAHPVSRIKQFGNFYYVIISQAYKIVIFTVDKLDYYETIDFSENKKIPSDICFANATTAYVAHENDETITCLDITVFKQSGSVEISGKAHEIECAGNQIFTANTEENSVSIIDSRTKLETNVVNVHDRPAFLALSDSGNKVVCISTGTGKNDNNPTKTAAVATLFNVGTSTVTHVKEIGIANIKALDINPLSLAINGYNLAFVPSDKYLLRFSAKDLSTVVLASRAAYRSVKYNFKNQELLIMFEELGKLYAITTDQLSLKEKTRVLLPNNTILVHPL